MFNSRKIVILVLVLIPVLAQSATIYTGQVIAITDGDTIKFLTPAKEQIKVRLAEIDTPEK